MEDDELEFALALSLLDMKDQQISTPNQMTLHPAVGGNASSVLRNSNAKTQGNSCTQQEDVPGREKSAFVAQSMSGSKENFRENQTYKSTHIKGVDNKSLGTSQALYVPDSSTSFSIPNTASVSGQVMKEEDLSKKPRCSKNRRQRRKAAAQQIVGLKRSPSAPPPVLLWFRRDLRLCDNPALIRCLELGAPVIPVFIWSPEEEGSGVTLATGGACKLP